MEKQPLGVPGHIYNNQRMEELRQMLNKQYQKEFSITAKLLEAGEAMPRITRGSHIEGINMEIGVEDE